MAANEKPQRPKPAPKPAARPGPKPAIGTPEGERIAKVLSRAGVSSRREAERLIEAGEVTVNGKIVTSPALNVTPADKITVSGEAVGAPDVARLWLYYKPEGLVTSASDEKGRDTVFDHLPEDMPRVMSIGRLDLNSEGLLLLTNDGTLKRQLELPSTGWLRKYRVRVKGNPTEPEIEPLRKGITIEGERFQPMEVKIDRHQGANAWLTVGLREGKNREIRRAMFAIGLTVNRLIRVSYGPFRLNEMEPGDVEEVKARILRDQLGALISGQLEEVSEPARPKSRVRTTSRTGTDDDRPARSSPTRPPRSTRDDAEIPAQGTRTFRSSTARTRTEDAKPARSTSTRGPRPPRDAEDTPARTGVTRTARGTADTPARSASPKPGAVSSARGRKALGQLADAWQESTGVRGKAASAAARGRSTTGAKPASSPKSPPRSGGPAKPKPPPRRK